MLFGIQKSLAAVSVFALLSLTPSGPSLTISITDLRNNKGHVLVSVFKGEEGFPSKAEKAYRKERLTISNGKAVIVFPSLPAGNYAVAILHDENDDLKMNTNFLGMPKEGYGFSNNVMGVLGPPSFSKANFILSDGKNSAITIRARY